MKRDWYSEEFKTLVTLGESTTAGGSASCRERCWASLLANQINQVQRVPVKLVNVGIGGNVISNKAPSYLYSGRPAANERLETHVFVDVANRTPVVTDLLIISYGLNDARGGTPIDLFRSEMEDLIGRVRTRTQPLIVLLGPYYMYDFTVGGQHWSHGSLDLFYNFNQTISAIADAQDCLFVDLLATYRQADWLVHFDGVHANDLGHRVVANKIFEILASNCSGLAKETKYLERQFNLWRDESVLRDNER
jgi:lysophospholipase L1-like esterase